MLIYLLHMLKLTKIFNVLIFCMFNRYSVIHHFFYRWHKQPRKLNDYNLNVFTCMALKNFILPCIWSLLNRIKITNRMDLRIIFIQCYCRGKWRKMQCYMVNPYMSNSTPPKQTLKRNVIHKSISCVLAGKTWNIIFR